MSKLGSLRGVRLVQPNQLCFILEGEHIEEEGKKYRSGDSFVEPLALKANLDFLRTYLNQFMKTRNNESTPHARPSSTQKKD